VTASIYHLLRTLFFLIPTIACYSIVAGMLTPISSLWDHAGRFGNTVMRIWCWLVLATTGVRVDVSGLARLVPGATYVFVSNHQSMYDIPVIFRWLPYQLRVIAKQSLGSVPFVGWHLRRTGHVLVNRGRPDRSGILRQWRRLVEQRLSLVIFPERGRPCRAVQSRQFPAGDRGGNPRGADVDRREPVRDAQRGTDHAAGVRAARHSRADRHARRYVVPDPWRRSPSGGAGATGGCGSGRADRA
jgi:1-acyl-sn-glycerol-3-phosphate acyltransferase